MKNAILLLAFALLSTACQRQDQTVDLGPMQIPSNPSRTQEANSSSKVKQEEPFNVYAQDSANNSLDNLKLVYLISQDTFVYGAPIKGTISVENLPPDATVTYGGEGVKAMKNNARYGRIMIMPSLQFENGSAVGSFASDISAEIHCADGRTHRLVAKRKFIIRPPRLQITPSADQALFKGCCNTITVDCPDLGKYYSPRFTATDGQALQSLRDLRQVTLIPDSDSTMLGVESFTESQQHRIGSVTYKVLTPPLPKLEVVINGDDSCFTTRVMKSGSITVKVRPDMRFRRQCPMDCRYIVTTIRLYVLEKGVPRLLDEFSGKGKDAVWGVAIKMSALQDLGSGTRLRIVVDEVNRVGCQNRLVSQEMPENARTFDLTLD